MTNAVLANGTGAQPNSAVAVLDETIAAISTAVGEGALAVIRLSGPGAFVIADQLFQPLGKQPRRPSEAPSHTVHYGKIVSNGQTVDEVMLTVLREPHTFTRENMVEISCHGGVLAVRQVLQAALAKGARLANPGEFTLRAFLNGRIDLTQAEAIADVIRARTDLALFAAQEQLAGKLSRKIQELRDQLIRTLAHLEAHIDFPDEDIAPETAGQMVQRLEAAVEFMDQLLQTAPEGQVLRQGLRAALVGRPNVGKSSLLNQLLGHERAIVSPIPGTTRDTIEEMANIRGIPVIFIDTAGLRESQDVLEREGVRRSEQALARAELILYILDRSEPLSETDEAQLTGAPDPRWIVVRNKSDLAPQLELPEGLKYPVVDVSCTSGAGLEILKDTIRDKVWAGQVSADMLQVMINTRHQDALQRARAAVVLARDGLRQARPLELVALDLRIAMNAVGEIVGKTWTEDLLDSIFSQFCIGK